MKNISSKKIIISMTILCILVIFFSINVVYGSNGTFGFDASRIFGGKIANTKAQAIQDLEDQGYSCQMNGGTSIKVTPVSSLSQGKNDYFIEAGNKSRTGYKENTGQSIFGTYQGTETITCTKSCPPTICTATATLDKIKIWGNSKQ